jgi:hypothetical protein
MSGQKKLTSGDGVAVEHKHKRRWVEYMPDAKGGHSPQYEEDFNMKTAPYRGSTMEQMMFNVRNGVLTDADHKLVRTDAKGQFHPHWYSGTFCTTIWTDMQYWLHHVYDKSELDCLLRAAVPIVEAWKLQTEPIRPAQLQIPETCRGPALVEAALKTIHADTYYAYWLMDHLQRLNVCETEMMYDKDGHLDRKTIPLPPENVYSSERKHNYIQSCLEEARVLLTKNPEHYLRRNVFDALFRLYPVEQDWKSVLVDLFKELFAAAEKMARHEATLSTADRAVAIARRYQLPVLFNWLPKIPDGPFFEGLSFDVASHFEPGLLFALLAVGVECDTRHVWTKLFARADLALDTCVDAMNKFYDLARTLEEKRDKKDDDTDSADDGDVFSDRWQADIFYSRPAAEHKFWIQWFCTRSKARSYQVYWSALRSSSGTGLWNWLYEDMDFYHIPIDKCLEQCHCSSLTGLEQRWEYVTTGYPTKCIEAMEWYVQKFGALPGAKRLLFGALVDFLHPVLTYLASLEKRLGVQYSLDADQVNKVWGNVIRFHGHGSGHLQVENLDDKKLQFNRLNPKHELYDAKAAARRDELVMKFLQPVLDWMNDRHPLTEKILYQADISITHDCPTDYFEQLLGPSLRAKYPFINKLDDPTLVDCEDRQRYYSQHRDWREDYEREHQLGPFSPEAIAAAKAKRDKEKADRQAALDVRSRDYDYDYYDDNNDCYSDDEDDEYDD